MRLALAVAQALLFQPQRALAAFYWFVRGKKVRARNRLRLAVAQSPSAYPRWIESKERLDVVAETTSSVIAGWGRRPRFSVVVYPHSDATDDEVLATVRSVSAQWYGAEELLLFHPGGPELPGIDLRFLSAPNDAHAINLAIDMASGDYIVAIRAGDHLSPAALFRLAEALQPDWPALVYGDEDRLDHRGRRVKPWFKPQWNEELFLAQDFVSSACALKTDAARAAVPVEDDLSSVAAYALILRMTANGQSVVHVPHILCHRPAKRNSADQAGQIDAVARHLSAQHVGVGPGPFGSVRVTWPLPDPAPKVSIIVPTRDKVNLLRACVDGVLSRTDYPEFELLIVDNDSVEPRTRAYLDALARDPRVRVMRYSGAYNYSAINNRAVAESRGAFVCLLNNDTEVIDGDWLTTMMRQATRPHVGAVGAKLLYADGSIQHAGVVVGLGDAAGHAHRFLGKGEPGYFNLPHLPHYVSAVTAACLVVEKRKFEAVGGLDADQLAVAFNDVDLCLKLGEMGWRNVYEPAATLIHHESKSRGRDISPQHIERYTRELAVFQQRWRTRAYRDPVHNRNLDRAHESYLIRI